MHLKKILGHEIYVGIPQKGTINVHVGIPEKGTKMYIIIVQHVEFGITNFGWVGVCGTHISNL